MCNLWFFRILRVVTILFFVIEMTAQQLIPMPREIRADTTCRFHLRQVDAKVNPRLKLPDEGYMLVINNSIATLRARTERGLVGTCYPSSIRRK